MLLADYVNKYFITLNHHFYNIAVIICVMFPLSSVGMAGERYLTQQGTPYDSDWDLWNNVMAILIIAVVFFIMTYFMLRRIKKLK